MTHIFTKSGKPICLGSLGGEQIVVTGMPVSCLKCERLWAMLQMTSERQARIDKARQEIKEGKFDEL